MNRQSNFSLFRSHLDLAHSYWEHLLQEGDFAIDATCGNGHDTLKLIEILKEKKGGVIGIDIQSQAIAQTQKLLDSHSSKENVYLFEQSHEEFPSLAREHPIRLVVYNLGYLPGGDKQKTTLTMTTLTSVRKALDLIVPGGAVSITCYPGHPEGALEESALSELVAALSPALWNVCLHAFTNRKASPRLLFIQKSTM